MRKQYVSEETPTYEIATVTRSKRRV